MPALDEKLMASFRRHLQAPLTWLQCHSPAWTIGLGAILGLLIGTAALLSFKGVTGVVVCLVTLGLTVWRAKDAEPEYGPDEKPESPKEVSPPAPEPRFSEPLEMIELPGDTFLMGSPRSNSEAYDDERPQHEVAVSAFCISRYPVTRQLYRDIVGSAPKEWSRDTKDHLLPANFVAWFEAATFCNALSAHVGLAPCYRIDGERVEWDREADGYRLPTEAEWEYACRAGTTSKWFFGDDSTELGHYAWFASNSEDKVHPVGEKKPNRWDLHDMIGNVWEWCWDWYAGYPSKLSQAENDPTGPANGTRRVLRGGSWVDDPWLLRSALRFWDSPVVSDDVIGFRCMRRPRRQP